MWVWYSSRSIISLNSCCRGSYKAIPKSLSSRSLIHLLNYLVGACHLWATVPGTRKTAVHKRDKNPALEEFIIHREHVQWTIQQMIWQVALNVSHSCRYTYKGSAKLVILFKWRQDALQRWEKLARNSRAATMVPLQPGSGSGSHSSQRRKVTLWQKEDWAERILNMCF